MKCKKRRCPYVGVIEKVRAASGARDGEGTEDVVMRLRVENDLLKWALGTVTNCHGLGEDKC
jgi:hypothetical protein